METAQPSITCPRCGMTSYNPNDIREGYCGNCHDWTRVASRDRFAAELAGHERALIAISGEALYNIQVHLIFDMLDMVDEIADQETAGRIASALAGRWADAPARVAEAQKAAEFPPGMAVQIAARLMADLKADAPGEFAGLSCRCGSGRFVSVSLNGGHTRRAQCVPCGKVHPEWSAPGWKPGGGLIRGPRRVPGSQDQPPGVRDHG